MALTAVYSFLLQSILLMGISEADPFIDVSSSEIILGNTTTLDINCTFSLNNYPDMAAFISLVLSRAKATGQDFQELAAITEFSADSPALLTNEKVSATGVHSQTGESFLQLTWEYPTELQAGIYKCSAHGMDVIGHTIEMTNTSSVTVDIFVELRQLKMHELLMKNQIQALENNRSSMELEIQFLQNDTIYLENQIQTLENDKESMAERIQDLEESIQDLQKVRWYPLGQYENHFYYLSTENAGEVDDAIDACETMGGELAIMNDQDEYTAIRDFLGNTSGISAVAIAGNDEDSEGDWVLPNSNTSLPFTAWKSGGPGNSTMSNCLILDSDYSWLMNTATCGGTPTVGWRYLCELEYLQNESELLDL